MASTVRHHILNNLDLMTNLSIGAFHKIYLVDANGNEEDIDDRFLKKITFNNFLNQYDDDFEYLLKLHIFQGVQLNGGTYNNNDTVLRPELPNTFTSDGKADKFHTHQISEVIQLPEQLNQRRNRTDYNFRNINEDLVINGLKFKCSNQEKDLCVVLGEINKKLDDLVDSLYGLDLISDFETIANVISNFVNPTNPFNWTTSYFENSNLKNGLIHALINYLIGKISNALSSYTDTSDTNYFIPSNHRYLRKNSFNQLIYPVYKANNTNIWGHYPVFNRVAFSNNGIQTYGQEESISGLISRYNNLTTSNIGFNYKQALILDNTPLEFKNGSSIQLDTLAGDSFKITSGNYYWKDGSNINNLSILNGVEKTLMLLDDTNAFFHNRLKDYTTGKKYVLEDEVGGGDITINKNYYDFEDNQYYTNISNITKHYSFIEDNRVHYNNSKTYKNNIFYEDVNNYFLYETKNLITNEFKSIFTGIFYETNDTYIDSKKTNIYDYSFNDNLNISTKKLLTNNYYENHEDYIDNRRSYFSQFIDNATQVINHNNKINNQYTENYLLTTNDKKIYTNNILEQTNQVLNNTKHITNHYTENMTQNINKKDFNWYILNDNHNVYYAPSTNYIISYVYNDSPLLNAIALINASLTSLNTRITLAETNITSHNSRLNIIEDVQADHLARITQAETNITSHNSRLSALETMQANHSSQLNSHNTRLNAIETRLNNIDIEILNLKKPNYNIFRPTNVFYPEILGGQNLNFQLLFKNTETEVFFQTDSLKGSTSGSPIGFDNEKITISTTGVYEFKFTIDLVKYSPSSSKEDGNIRITLSTGSNVFLSDYTYFLPALDYGARTLSLFYYKQSNDLMYITCSIYHNISNNGSTINGQPDENRLLLSPDASNVIVIKH